MSFLKFKGKLAKSDFLKNAAKLMAGTVIAQALTVLASPILTRLYTPSDFGAFALFSSITTVLAIIATGRYDMAIVVARSKKLAFNLLVLAFILISLTAILVIVLSAFYRENLKQYFGSQYYTSLIFIIPLTIVFISSYQLLSFWANREKDYSIMARTKVMQNLLNIAISVSLGYLLNGSIGLILGLSGGAFVALFSLLIRYYRSFKTLWKEVFISRIKQGARHYRKFPQYSMPSSFLDTFSNQIPIFIITLYFGTALAGHFGFAYRIISLPIALIGASFAQVFFQKLTETYKNHGNCNQLIFKTWKTLILVGILPCAVLLLAGPQLFSLVFGSEWKDAGKIAQYLAVMQLFVLVSSPTSTALVVFGAQNISFAFGLASSIYRPLTLYIGYAMDSFYLGLILFMICEIIQIIIYNLVIIRYSFRAQKAKVA